MRFQIILFLFKYLIIYSKYDCALALTGHNVVNVQENEHKYVVAVAQIQSTRPLQFYKLCIGTLVTRNDVITAEHCLAGRNSSVVEVFAGSNNLTRCRHYKLNWWISYDQWMNQHNREIEFEANDIIMLRLLRVVSSHIIPASISYIANNLYYGLDLILASWTRRSSGELSLMMEKGIVSILTSNQCNRLMTSLSGGQMEIPVRYLCSVANPPIHVTQGDSGGPLLYENTLVGINRGTCPNVNSTRIANIHLGIDYYREYILDVLNNY